MNINPLSRSSPRQQLIFVCVATLGYSVVAYDYWKSEKELAVFYIMFVSSLLLFIITIIGVFNLDEFNVSN